MLYITSKYIDSFVPRLVQFHNQIHLNTSLYSSTIVIDNWFAFWIYIRSLHKYYIGAKELRTEFAWYIPQKVALIHPSLSIPLAVGSAFEQAQLAKKVVESFETSLHGPLRTNEAIELITTLGLFKCSQKHSVL